MCQLLETIKCCDGKLYNLDYHQDRFNETRKSFLGCTNEIKLSKVIQIPEEYKKGLFRCRIVYSNEIAKIEFFPHNYKEIKSLKLIEDDNIDYKFKYSDRKQLNELFEKRDDCDDILIVKNGCITDSFTANPVFFDGSKWWTPDTPLLSGTQRAKLIGEGKLSVCIITPETLNKYKKTGLINALQDLENMPVILIENIK